MEVRMLLDLELGRNYRQDYDRDLEKVVETGLCKTVAQIAKELGIPLEEAT